MADTSNIHQSDEDAEVSRILRQGIGMSVHWAESKLSRERTRVAEYVDGMRPHRMHNGDADYNSYDVYEAVESMKSQILETFSGNSRPVTFNAHRDETPEQANVRTDYCTDVVHNQNPGFAIMRDTIGNALKARNGVVKVWWKPDVHEEVYELSQPVAEELQALLAANPTHSLKEIKLHEDGTTIERAVLTITKDRSKVQIAVLPPDEFGISPAATSIADADLVYHKYQRTVSELIKAGYNPKIVKQLQTAGNLWLTDFERVERFNQTDDSFGLRDNENDQLAGRRCTVYECYAEFDLAKRGSDDEGVSHLYKVVLVGDVVLDKERIDRKPFVVFTPLPRENAFWGFNYAKMVQATQLARTYLTRSIINHTLITNNPRMAVVKGAVANPRELMENRFGGIVNVTRPDGVFPLPQASLNPFVFQTVQMLQANKEELTGVSQLSQGLDKDAVSKQNSQDMIHELITVSQIRQKIVARNFAEFLRDLYAEVHRLVAENEDAEKIVEIAGKWTPIDFTAWPQDCKMTVSFALGYGEEKREAQKWMGVNALLSQIPQLAPQYGPAQAYQVVKNAMLAAGIKDVDTYLLPPEKATQPPPNPMLQAEIALKQADAASKQAAAQATVQSFQLQQAELASKERLETARIQVELKRLELEMTKLAQAKGIEQDKLAHKVIVDNAEIVLQEKALANDKLQAEAMPTRS